MIDRNCLKARLIECIKALEPQATTEHLMQYDETTLSHLLLDSCHEVEWRRNGGTLPSDDR